MLKNMYTRAWIPGSFVALLVASAVATVAVRGQQPPGNNPADIAGSWVQAGGGATFSGGTGFQEDADERMDGPALVEYAGIPLNEAGRQRALSYYPELLTVPEHQCMPHPATYSFWGPGDGRGRGIPEISQQLDKN